MSAFSVGQVMMLRYLPDGLSVVANTSDWIPFKKYGCFVHLATYRGRYNLLTANMLRDGTIEQDEWEITAPPDQQFLDAINAVFNTSFTMDQFPGR